MAKSAFVLLHQTSEGLRRVEVAKPDLVVRKVNLHHFTEIPFNGETGYKVNWLDPYCESLKEGENYLLFWLGGEVVWWDWVILTGQDFYDRTPASASEVKDLCRRLILPASNVLEFTVRTYATPWPERHEVVRQHGKSLARKYESEWRLSQAQLNPPTIITDLNREYGSLAGF